MGIERVFQYNQPCEGRVTQQKYNSRELDVVQPRSKMRELLQIGDQLFLLRGVLQKEAFPSFFNTL